MKEIQVLMYQCDHCSHKSEWKYQIEIHESTCLHEQAIVDNNRWNYDKKVKNIENNCIKWAREDKLLKLMVENEIDKESVLARCRDIYEDNVWDDIGPSSWRSEVYQKMYDALFVNEKEKNNEI